MASAAGNRRVRKSALELPQGDRALEVYATAVERLHKLPTDDARNWTRLAQIHADHCVHGQLDFLHWHRHYINYFEQVCGEVVGDPEFALPYWDWSHGKGALPDSFYLVEALNVEHWKDPGTYSSPNWGDVDTVPFRGIRKGVGVQSVGPDPSLFTRKHIEEVLNYQDYRSFVGSLEGGPHNAGHLTVGSLPQGKQGHMANGLSPLDPIFWLHHANVDRLWAQWQVAGNPSPKTDAMYRSVFSDAHGRAIAEVSAASAVDFAQLGYTYELFGPGGERTVLEEVAASRQADRDKATLGFQRVIGASTGLDKIVPFVVASISVRTKTLSEELLGETTVIDASLPPLTDLREGSFRDELFPGFGRIKVIPRRILLRLKDVHAQFDEAPVVGVFLNHPKLNEDTRFAGEHFAGSFAFFGSRSTHSGHESSQQFVVDLTSALRGTADLRGIDRLEVQLLTLPASGSNASQGSFSVGSAEILSL